jgi:hypothetical protein
MRLGISVRIDVTKIDKARLYKGEKGTYLDLTTFIDTENKDTYNNNGFISQSTTKEERESGVQTPILGNVRVFHQSAGDTPTTPTPSQPIDPAAGGVMEDDIPFAQHMRGTII